MLHKLIKKYAIRFLHPHSSSEARVVSENLVRFKDANVETYLPKPTSIMPDKLRIHDALSKQRVPVPITIAVKSLKDIDNAFSEIGHPLWIRAKHGAVGRLSLKVDTLEQARHWMRLNALQKRAAIAGFILQEYLPGRGLAFDSLWFKGELITFYARERLEYALKHVSLSGVTGTPSIARTVKDQKLNQIGVEAIKALDQNRAAFFRWTLKKMSLASL
jgi:carbamoyl-phosphate synthase large subunit